MNLFLLFLLALMVVLLVAAAVLRPRDRRAADRLCTDAVIVGTIAAMLALAGSWQEFAAMCAAIPCVAVAVMAMVLVAIGPDMRRDLRFGWRVDRALAARGRHLVVTTAPDPDHPPTATARTG